MPSKKSTRAKTQTLSLRLDPKTRFVLEFIAKVNRQSITTVVEEAIRLAGQRAQVGSNDDVGRTWQNYWDISEGVRVMYMLADEELPSTYEDDELRDFIDRHSEFFCGAYELGNPDRLKLEILWPNIEKYLSLWRETRHTDLWEVGRQMVSDLESAAVEPPEWPRQA